MRHLPQIQSAVLLLLWLIAFYPVYPSLVDTWLNHSNNSHGILVPLIAGFFIWQKRGQLQAAPLNPSLWGGLLLLCSLLLYGLFYIGSVAVACRLMIILSLVGLIIFNYGTNILKIIRFPIFFLIFMIPIPVAIYTMVAFPLQLFATDVAAAAINLLSIPVYKEGNMLYFVQTSLEVAEACSGLRSMTAFLMLGCLFAYLMDKGRLRRAVLVASGIPLAIFANIVRVTGTGILAHFYGARVARGFMHEFSGMAVFAFGFVLLFILYSLLNRQGPEPAGSDHETSDIPDNENGKG
ncbi:MAG: exosortase/archaeosortase family protein [Desulfohalobiaceae bacterium]|nr:exosortase/archaeosortase family protein [Desulfohalobiaceae bacterium]